MTERTSREIQELLTNPDLQALSKDVIEFSERDERTQRLFRTCGLYVVGSSLVKPNPNDLDITLVGLDFRSVFTYGQQFLNGPQESDEDAMAYNWDIRPHNMILDLLQQLFEKRSLRFDRWDDFKWHTWSTLNPFYMHEDEKYTGIKVPPLGPIDFFIHGENLLVNAWKWHQVKNALPFAVIHEWNAVGIESVLERSIVSLNALPKFIDPLGQKR